ncbi:MAG: hypothetical protein E7455_02810 [Ruminococcaceae bacterium]|nr:hypothetical protein [Oscillospiraceae bacterium]
MKKVLSLIILLALIFSFSACDGDAYDNTISYYSAEAFEDALNEGTKVKGKLVQFCVEEYAPDSILGINCHAGEHLNFIFDDELDVKAGDTITVRITKEPSKIFLIGSWEVPCEFIELVTEGQENNIDKEPVTEPSKKPATEPSKEPTTKPKNMAGAPDDWTNLLEKHYEEVKKQFEDAGFTNIICFAHEIDYNENYVFEGSVLNIAIGENGEICTFEKGEQWEKDIKIRIDYRVKPAEAPKPDTTKIVLPEAGSKLAKDFDVEGQSTIYYTNVDGISNKPSIQTWGSATVTDGVAEYLGYLEELGFTVKITNRTHKEPYSGFHIYETDIKVSNSSVSWTMYLCIQKEAYVEYEFHIYIS